MQNLLRIGVGALVVVFFWLIDHWQAVLVVLFGLAALELLSQISNRLAVACHALDAVIQALESDHDTTRILETLEGEVAALHETVREIRDAQK